MLEQSTTPVPHSWAWRGRAAYGDIFACSRCGADPEVIDPDDPCFAVVDEPLPVAGRPVTPDPWASSDAASTEPPF